MWNRGFHGVLGFGGQFDVMPGNKFKQSEKRRWVFDRGRLAQGDAFIDDVKFRSRQWRPAFAKPTCPRLFWLRNLVEQHRQSVNGPRMPEINSHPVAGGSCGAA